MSEVVTDVHPQAFNAPQAMNRIHAPQRVNAASVIAAKTANLIPHFARAEKPLHGQSLIQRLAAFLSGGGTFEPVQLSEREFRMRNRPVALASEIKKEKRAEHKFAKQHKARTKRADYAAATQSRLRDRHAKGVVA